MYTKEVQEKISKIKSEVDKLTEGFEITVNVPFKFHVMWSEGTEAYVQWSDDWRHQKEALDLLNKKEEEFQKFYDNAIKILIEESDKLADSLGVNREEFFQSNFL